MKKYLLALDEGTTSARSILFDRGGNIVAMAQREFRQIYPQSGWVEQDALEIYAAQFETLTECLAKAGVDPDEIAGIGITNQRETTVVWDKKTGEPVCHAIVWQCRRTADFCERLEKEGWAETIQNATGLRPDAYFSGTKLRWILENVSGARQRAERGELLFGTIDTWLVWKLTGGKVHITDRTNASRTMLYHLEKDDWDEELLSLLQIPRCMLPKIASSSEIYGEAEILGKAVPIGGIAGDQQAALFGQCCFEPGDAKVTYGTGCFLLANTGKERVYSQNGLLTTLAATEQGKEREYVLEGSVFVGGAVVQWLRDELQLIATSAESEAVARSVPSSGGVVVVPAFAGLGAPYWDMHARGVITGLTRGSGRAHIVRAALDAIAFQTCDVIDAMRGDFPLGVRAVQADGGASANDLLMQIQADLAGLPVNRSAQREATAAGAAYLAGLAVGFYRDREEIRALAQAGEQFLPQITFAQREERLQAWHRAVNACRSL